MKTAIKTSALFLGLALLSTGVFAAAKNNEGPAATGQNIVLFTSLPNDLGVQVIVHKVPASVAIVKIYDANGKLIMTDQLSKKDAVSRKGYDLGELDNGDYTFQVSANNEVTKRVVHIYNDEKDQKAFFFEL